MTRPVAPSTLPLFDLRALAALKLELEAGVEACRARRAVAEADRAWLLAYLWAGKGAFIGRRRIDRALLARARAQAGGPGRGRATVVTTVWTPSTSTSDGAS